MLVYLITNIVNIWVAIYVRKNISNIYMRFVHLVVLNITLKIEFKINMT
jgi:hypothetical protein